MLTVNLSQVMSTNLQSGGLLKPSYASIKAQLMGYNTEALEDNFTAEDIAQYALWAFDTLLKSQADDAIIKAAVKKKFEIYPSPRSETKTAEEETFDFLRRYMTERGIALPMELIIWREGTGMWFKICLWKKAVHLLLMSEEEYREHVRHRQSQNHLNKKMLPCWRP